MNTYGFRSDEYYFAFYLLDYCLLGMLYLVILGLLGLVLRDSQRWERTRLAFLASFALGGVLVLSFVYYASFHVKESEVRGIERNGYFGIAVLAAVFWISLTFFSWVDPQLRIVASGLGIQGALQGIQWATRNLAPSHLRDDWWLVLRRLGPAGTVIMLALWCYALTRLLHTVYTEPILDDA